MKIAPIANISLQGKIYIVRLLFCLTTLGLLAFNDLHCRERSNDHLWLLVGGLLYPQLGHLLFGRLDINRRRGHALFLADGMFVGAVIAALDYAFLPGIVLAIISLFNWMVVGGAILVAAGSVFMFMGMLTVGISPDMISISSLTSCPITNWLASLIAIGYFLAVARILHKLIGELRLQQVGFQARSDSANSAKAMAEQALLAVLPSSAARQLEINGSVADETIPDATLLLLDIQHPDSLPSRLETMQEALPVFDSILTRHGIDLIKSFGCRILAMSRTESGADGAFRAFLEIANYYKDHEPEESTVCGILHQGSVTTGLVQPQRLNLDVFGPGIDELTGLADEAAAKHLSGLIVTTNAWGKLSIPPEGKQLRQEHLRLTCYQYSA